MKSKFSIITPNYNMGHYLVETIESVLRNLKPGDEYFIIDGGSTDDSIDIIRSYERHLTGWISEPDYGYADALAKGFARTKGDFQCWINSGDLLLDGALDLARKSLNDINADFIFGDDFYIDDQSNVIFLSKGRVGSLKNFMLFGSWTPLQDACFWRRALYERVGGIDSTLKFAADYDLFLRFSLKGRCKYVPLAFSAFRKHEGQKSISQAINYKKEREKCMLRELEKLGRSNARVMALKAYYWVLVHLRAHIMQRLWRMKHIAWGTVYTLKCQSYI